MGRRYPDRSALHAHSFSIHASNVGTASLEGASRGGRTRWGFEYTVPITLRRYGRSRGGSEGTTQAAATPMPKSMPMAKGMATGDSVFVDIRDIKYGIKEIVIAPGTTVVWRNRDPIQHSVTADGNSFDSGLIDPNGSFTMTFQETGEYSVHCVPHPFMRARVVVQVPMDQPALGGRGQVVR